METLIPKNQIAAFLTKRGYLAVKDQSEQAFQTAWAQFRADREKERPVIPSLEDPSREAECRTCRDAGWVDPTPPVLPGDLPNYCRPIPCPDCSAWRFEEERKRRIMAQSGIPIAHHQDDFGNFEPVPGTQQAFEAASQLAEGTAPFVLLLIYGGVGNGKTHLGYAACLRAKERGLHIKFQPLSDLFSELRLEMSKKDGRVEGVVNKIKTVPFLVLDDMAASYDTPWQLERLLEIVDYRYRERLPLIFTTNRDCGLNPKVKSDLKRLPEQILRRFREVGTGLTVQNSAGEYRKRGGK